MELKFAVAENFPTMVRIIRRTLNDVGSSELRINTAEQSSRNTNNDRLRPRWGRATRWVNKLADISASTKRKKLR